MSDVFFIQDPFTISKQAVLYAANLPDSNYTTYDYILDINVGATNLSSMNAIFNQKRFIADINITNNLSGNTIDLTINASTVSTLLFSNSVVDIRSTKTAISGAGAYNTLTRSTNKLLGARFLEIVATKIFGHAKASTAIEHNETYYTTDYSASNTSPSSLIGQIAWGMSNAIVNKKSDIFNSYISTDRLQDSIASEVTNVNGVSYWDFNFQDSVWEFPVTFHTTISSSGTTSMGELNNGPNTGGAQLQDGAVSVPILLRFLP